METNGNSVILYLIVGVVAAIVLGVIVYFIARAMKGSIEIALKQKNVSSGDMAEGQLTLKAKKAIDVDRMFIALIGEREIRKRSSSGNGNSTSWDEFYRDEHDVLMSEHLRAGFTQKYDFALQAPTKQDTQNLLDNPVGALTNKIDNALVKGIANQVGQIALQSSGLRHSRKRWKVVARLETKGVDLADSKKIHISL
ncbi:hypothetical protein [Rubritalea profundi]|uniref:Uncharacterized protein n=1 Tax=Rubritalea profundi TaxID=1658618 RepID=A0A2S7U0K5_9BACT|nr:hypothetical protein [Rubritalea profundi]PQJ28539.1 hypothetical protein BSZ32_08470 [Rubritalea profundi]